MTKKKATRKSGPPRPDRYSRKRSGFVATSVRLDVNEMKLVRQASTLDGISANLWMKQVLLPAAKARIAIEQNRMKGLTSGTEDLQLPADTN